MSEQSIFAFAQGASEKPQSKAKVREDKAIYNAMRIVERRLRKPGDAMQSPENAVRLFSLSLATEEREHFEVAFLDTKNRLISKERLFSGTIDGTSVHPRVVAQRALANNCAAIMMAHNHPSGDPTPSSADRLMTRQIKEALALFEIRVLDHIIVGGTQIVSMAQAGMI